MSSEKCQWNSTSNSEKGNLRTQCYDPLEGLGDIVPEDIFFRMNSIVFAEPLNHLTNKEKSVETTASRYNIEETTQLDNVTVKKRPGRRKKLYVHLHDDTNLTCPMNNCNKTFSSPTLLKAHIRKVHYSKKTFVCEVCGVGFSAHYLLKRHSAVHGLEKVQCPVCKKMLSLRTNFPAHLRSHSRTQRSGRVPYVKGLPKKKLGNNSVTHEESMVAGDELKKL